MNLTNRRALVTGGSKGIGKAISLEMAKSGADVVLVYRSDKQGAIETQKAIEALGKKVISICADISNPSHVKKMVHEAAEALGGLDILVNCAGILPQNPIAEITEAQWRKVIDVNLSGAFFTAQAAIPYLKNSECGRIISITSQAAFTGSVNHVHYCASKAGLLGMTFALAKELGPLGITVNTVAPGRIETEMLVYGQADKRDEWLKNTPLGRLGKSEDIVKVVAFLASSDSGYITGANINVNGGILMG